MGAFPDIHALSLACRFTNCHHQAEPGCAVQAAIQAGSLEKVRLESFEKLLKESRQFEGKQSARGRIDETRRAKALTRSLRGSSKRPGDFDEEE
jgi:ribosome biogenesis GTPase